MLHPTLSLPLGKIRELCRAYDVRELAVFGSAVREDFSASSDVDFLVEFSPEAKVGLLRFAALQRELAELLRREIDLVSKGGLHPVLREQILEAREIVFAAEPALECGGRPPL